MRIFWRYIQLQRSVQDNRGVTRCANERQCRPEEVRVRPQLSWGSTRCKVRLPSPDVGLRMNGTCPLPCRGACKEVKSQLLRCVRAAVRVHGTTVASLGAQWHFWASWQLAHVDIRKQKCATSQISSKIKATIETQRDQQDNGNIRVGFFVMQPRSKLIKMEISQSSVMLLTLSFSTPYFFCTLIL